MTWWFYFINEPGVHSFWYNNLERSWIKNRLDVIIEDLACHTIKAYVGTLASSAKAGIPSSACPFVPRQTTRAANTRRSNKSLWVCLMSCFTNNLQVRIWNLRRTTKIILRSLKMHLQREFFYYNTGVIENGGVGLIQTSKNILE